MKIVVVGNGEVIYLAKEVLENTVTGSIELKQACTLGGAELNRNGAAHYLKEQNLGNLVNLNIKNDYSIRDLNTMEQANWDLVKAMFVVAQETALPKIVNAELDNLVKK